MKKWLVLGIFLGISFSLSAQEDTKVIIQPSDTVRYPEAEDIMNPTPTVQEKVSLVSENHILPRGWYYQIVLTSQLENSIEASALIQKAFPGIPLYLRLTGKEYRCLIGPLGAGELKPILDKIKPLGLGDPILRYEG